MSQVELKVIFINYFTLSFIATLKEKGGNATVLSPVWKGKFWNTDLALKEFPDFKRKDKKIIELIFKAEGTPSVLVI